jgi:GMP synthase (glutamine-hydrolysing)
MARPKILVFQHVPYEPLGTLDPLLREAGFRMRYVNFGRDAAQRPALDRYAALIVLGGPMNANEIDDYPNLKTEVEILREALERQMSILGICLGAQLLAKALGGSVAQNDRPETANQPLLEQERERVDPERLRQQVPHYIDELQALSRETFGRWIERFDASVPRRRLLPSR